MWPKLHAAAGFLVSQKYVVMKLGRDVDFLTSPGDRNRSVFELSESGANKALLDSVQFHLDGLFTLKSPGPRALCVYKLIEICTSSKQVLFAFRSNGIASTLLRVVGLLQSEKDHCLRLCLQALALVLCQSENGDIIEGLEIPRNVFISLLTSILQDDTNRNDIINTAFERNSANTSSLLAGAEEQTANNIHRKRKFAGKKGSQISCGEILHENIPHLTQKTSQSSAKSGRMNNKTGEFIGANISKSTGNSSSTVIPLPINEFVQKLQQILPATFKFFGFGGGVKDLKVLDVVEIGRLLALTVVSRYLISAAQHDTRTEGYNSSNNHGSSSGSSDKSRDHENVELKSAMSRNNEDSNDCNKNDNNTDNYGLKPTIKNAVLSEYQALLRNVQKESIGNSDERNLSIRPSAVNIASNIADRIDRSDVRTSCFLTNIVTQIAIEIFAAIEILDEGYAKESISSYSQSRSKPKSNSKSKRTFQSQSQSQSDFEFDSALFEESGENIEDERGPRMHANSTINANSYLKRIGKSRINRIFQVLSLLEAACFRCPENQVKRYSPLKFI